MYRWTLAVQLCKSVGHGDVMRAVTTNHCKAILHKALEISQHTIPPRQAYSMYTTPLPCRPTSTFPQNPGRPTGCTQARIYEPMPLPSSFCNPPKQVEPKTPKSNLRNLIQTRLVPCLHGTMPCCWPAMSPGIGELASLQVTRGSCGRTGKGCATLSNLLASCRRERSRVVSDPEWR